MKRWIAWALAALLALSTVSALAEDTDTLWEKFYSQAVQYSAYRGTVTFSVSEEMPEAADPALWETLKTLAQQLTLTLEHTTSRTKDEGQANLIVSLNETPVSQNAYLYDEKLSGFSSDLLFGPNVYYTAARDWDWTRLIQSFAQGDNAWPPVWRMLLAVVNAPKEWKERASARLNLYETKLGIWLNGYATFASGREGEKAYSELSCQIPAQAMKAEIKQLLVDFYSDTELLALLREVVTPQEAAAYLQPSMMNSLFTMLDGLDMEGDVKVARRNEVGGGSLMDQISFPFSENNFLTALTLTLSAVEEGQQWEIEGGLQNGLDFSLACVASEDNIYTGSVAVLLPPTEEDGESFVVDDEAPGRESLAFDFSLTWDPGEETYSMANDRYSQTMGGSLLIRPQEGTPWPVQAVTLEATLASGSKKNAVTQLNGSLTWRDMDTDASIAVQLTSRTLAPFAYTTPSTLSSAVRLDLMSQESRAQLMQHWLNQLLGLIQPSAEPEAALPPLATIQPR